MLFCRNVLHFFFFDFYELMKKSVLMFLCCDMMCCEPSKLRGLVETHHDAENCYFLFVQFVLLVVVAVAAAVVVRLILDVTMKNDADLIPGQQHHSSHIVEVN